MARYEVFDSNEDLLGEVTDIDAIPEWENALQRTAKQIARANDGYILRHGDDGISHTVYDSQDDD